MYKILVLHVFLCCCLLQEGGAQKDLPGEAISCYSVQLGYASGYVKGGSFPDSNRIYYSGDLVLYDLLYQFDSLDNHVWVSSAVRHRLLLCDKGDPRGLLYDVTGGRVRWVPVDSVLNNEWFRVFNVYAFFRQARATLLSSVHDPVEGSLKEDYVLKADSGDLKLYLVFRDRYKKVPLSFSPQLDSIKNSKLCEMALYDSVQGPADGVLKPSLLHCRLEEVAGFDRQQVKGYFDWYRKEKVLLKTSPR